MKRFLILLTFISCSEPRTSNFNNWNLTFDYPTEWQLEKQSDGQGGYGIVLSSLDEYTIVSITAVNSDLTNEEFMELIMKQLDKDFANKQIEYDSPTNGQFGRYQSLKLNIKGVEQELGPFNGDVHGFRTGNKNIMVMAEWAANMERPTDNKLQLVESTFEAN